MKSLTVDMTDPKGIRSFAAEIEKEFPSANVVINNAGIMRPEKVMEQDEDPGDAESMITTNLLGPIRLSAALLPLLQKQTQATIMNVSSDLAFVPLAMTPTYCATKAALHSYSESLRYQLRESAVEVIELIPPYVATTLLGEQQASDPNAMPLDDFIKEVMSILQNHPEATEICVEKVKPLRSAAEGGQEKYNQFFKHFNDTMSEALDRDS